MNQEVPELGQLVDVRSRRYVVVQVSPSDVPADPLAEEQRQARQHLLTLSSVEDDGLGEELQVVWEIELGARAYEQASLPSVAGFDAPHRLDAFLDALRWGAVASADHRSLHAPFRSGITIEDYQLDPVVRSLQMPRVNLLVADDVGLGKTIEAGLVIQELLLRHRARSVLVVCPSGLQVQWRDQMRDKFGLEFRIINSETMRSLRRQRGLFVNPWTHFPRLITSIDFLKRERPLRLLQEVLPAEGESTYPRRFDMLIVDEAHNIAPSSSSAGRYAVDSQRTKAVRFLAPHFEHKLFMSATPHNGYMESFSSLLELLDNQRFHRGVRPDPVQLSAIMVRRLKRELPDRWDGTPRFPRRRIQAIEVRYTEEERKAHLLLERYRKLRQKSEDESAVRVATEFVLKLLKKRLFSSPQAFFNTLEKHKETLARGSTKPRKKAPSVQLLRRRIAEAEEEFADDHVFEEMTDEVVDSTTRTFAKLSDEEQEILGELTTWAEQASARPDEKAKALIKWLKDIVKPKGKWGSERVIIFTEYRATQKWLHTMLASADLGSQKRLNKLYGGMDSDEREAIKAAFLASPEESQVRILLATDAASEGIDLQNHCSHLVHYEIPWNPNRLEQRNGRIDRHGQRAEEVHVFHFVGAGYKTGKQARKPGDLEGDLEFLMVAATKVETIREDLGKVGPVIADQVAEAMLGKRAQLNTHRAELDAQGARKLLKLERKLREEIERLHDTLQSSRRELRLSPENVQQVVQTGLALAEQPALEPAEADRIWPDPSGARTTCPVFSLPPLRGSWARAAEGLEHPHTKEIRPIVFDHALAEGRDDVVLVHLNHRLVKMCLQLLRAEVWAVDSASLRRATARLVPQGALSEPVVVVHGRMIMLGGDNTRLHEELIFAGGQLKSGKLSKLGVNALADALKVALDRPVSEKMQERLQSLWGDILTPAQKALQARMKERSSSMQKKLEERAAKEATDIGALLLELQRTLQAELSDAGPAQLDMFSTEEQVQVEQNRESIRRRLASIPQEIEREKAAILARYAEPQARLFPVSVTFLVPEHLDRTGA